MRLTAENKRKLTSTIRTGAAKAFRQHGYDGVNLDALMKEAGLTRGAFYAHYPSKAALFADVMREEHPLLRMLERRTETNAVGLYEQMVAVFQGYLEPANLVEVFVGCSLAALTGDTARADVQVKQAFTHGFQSVCTEMARAQNQDAPRYGPPLLLATGAVRSAMAMAEPEARAVTLTNAWRAFLQLLPHPEQEIM
ncbi:MAG: helix-turn-helix domain-containing protein [Pseudomonadota bacterium]